MKQLRALVVDDMDDIRKQISKILTDLKIDVVEAKDGQEAVEIFDEINHAFDFITMDYQMPRLNGAEAAYQIRKKNHRVPIVCISASIPLMRPALKNIPHIYFLHKPLDASDLRQLLQEIFEYK